VDIKKSKQSQLQQQQQQQRHRLMPLSCQQQPLRQQQINNNIHTTNRITE